MKKAAANNWAAVELKRANWAEAARQAGKVLELDPSNVKALFRRAQARRGLGELLEAELDVKAALLLEPGNAEVAALARKLKCAHEGRSRWLLAAEHAVLLRALRTAC